VETVSPQCLDVVQVPCVLLRRRSDELGQLGSTDRVGDAAGLRDVLVRLETRVRPSTLQPLHLQQLTTQFKVPLSINALCKLDSLVTDSL
jgi:hypothetical protein